MRRSLFTRVDYLYRLMKRNSESSFLGKNCKIKLGAMSNIPLEINSHASTNDKPVEILESPVKSEFDLKEYRVIRLKNGLTALLISDLTIGPILPQEEEQADDAMSVGSAGSDDGTSIEGSDAESEASNMEEGEESDKKPKKSTENETQSAASLSIGVGSFEDPDDIPGLAHFLEHMVFMGSKKYPEENDFDAFIKKQGGHDNACTDWDLTNFYFLCQPRHFRKAVDKFAQFFISPLMKKDAMQREREAIESGHPIRKFAWGNMATLGGNSGDQQSARDEEIHKRLHQFRTGHYLAPSMRLAVQSRHSLDTLQNWVLECFGSIPSGPEVPQLVQVKHEKPFDTPLFNKFYHVAPVKDVCQVDLTWALPSLLDKYLIKPDKYISWLLGHEGQGSLLNYLKEKVWALQLYSGTDDSGSEHNSHFMQFGVSLVLTDEGLTNLKEVLECVFSYLNMLRREGPQERIFREIQSIQHMKFKFAPQLNASDTVESLSENMHHYPSQHYICGPELLFDFDPEAVTKCLQLLTPDRVNVYIPVEWLESWKSAQPRPELSLPPPNQYLTTDFTRVQCDQPDPEASPECVLRDEKGELCSVQLDLFIAILRQQLNRELYAAEVAELSYSIYSSFEGTACGLGMQLSGYNQKLPLLLEAILRQVVRFEQDLNPQMFLAVKDKQKKHYYNIFLKPSKLLKDMNSCLLKYHSWTAVDRYNAIDDISVSQFVQFVGNLRSRLYVRALMQGNLHKDQAIEVMQMVQSTLSYLPLPRSNWPELRMAQVEIGSRVCRVASFNHGSCNSVVCHIFFSGLATIHQCCIAELIMLMLEEASFDTLRTKEQLGYDVSCQDYITRGVLHFSVTVHSQEDKHSIDHVDGRIWEFLRGFKQKLCDLSEAEFEELRQSAMRQKMTVDLQLYEEVQGHCQMEDTIAKLISENSDATKSSIGKSTNPRLSEVVMMSPRSVDVPALEVLPPPIKSDNDKKEYRTIKLRNGLIALLVSDPSHGLLNAEEPSTNETTEVDDNEMASILSAASLSIGAGTFQNPDEFPGLAHFLEHMVSMGSEKYPGENDFASFIAKHGGSENAGTDREETSFYFSIQPKFFREALDRFAQFFIAPLLTKDVIQREREAVESGHPTLKFPWGNVSSLGGNAGDKQEETDTRVHEALHQFRRQYYTGRSMRLAVQSRHSLDVLERWVLEYFSPVLPGNDPIRSEGKEFPFDTPQFHKFYHVSPVSDTREICLTWALPSMHKDYEYRPDEHISHILGDEGKAGLAKYLRDKVWALQVTAGAEYSSGARNSQYLLYQIDIQLTEEGVEHLPEVLESVFGFLAMVKEEGPQPWIFKEQQATHMTTFKFAPQTSASSNVQSLSEHMLKFKPEHYICGQMLFFKYDPHMISEYVPEEWLESWKAAKPEPQFGLPPHNQFITTDYTVLDCDQCDPDAPPERVLCDEKGELWFKQDAKVASSELLVSMIQQQLLEETYSADAAGLRHGIGTGVDNIEISVYGFSEKLPVLLGTVVKHLVEFENEVTQEQFEASNTWTVLDNKAAIVDITLEQLKEFARSLRSRLYIKALMQGNLSRDLAISIMKEVQTQLNYKPLLPNTWPQLRLGQVEVGSRVCRVASFNNESSNSTVTHYFYCGFNKIQDASIHPIMTMMNEAAFDQLRTKEQLAYVVQSGHVNNRGFLRGFEEKLAALTPAELEDLLQTCKKQTKSSDLQLSDEVGRNWSEITTGSYLFNRRQIVYDSLSNSTLPDLLAWYKKNVLQLDSTTRHLCLQVQGFAKEKETPEVSTESEQAATESTEEPEKEIKEPEENSEGTEDGAPDATDSGDSCVPGVLKILIPPENGISKPITDIEEYRTSLFYFPALRKFQPQPEGPAKPAE
ncbi:hypothetical protein B566_EDAN010578 [Ephemera danica]|nr:hypothetical protein B566_EDAN010578 [Ephemera danica]